jgi:predicted ATPase
VLAAAPEVRDLLAAAPKMKALVTSRVRLSVYGEQEFPVMPLPGPDPRHLPGDVTRFDSVALFIERAKASNPAFHVTDDNAPAVAEIVFRLDGLPLAIELAASRLKLLPPQQLLSRLGQRLPLLSGARDLPERQRTLRGAIGWSYDLLDSPERHLFARASVFRGGCSLDAADEVCNPGADLGIDTLDGVASLVDNSLLRKAESNAQARFGMLETIREFATERLRQEFDADATAVRHAERIARLTEEAEPHLELGEAASTLELLDHEHDNVRGALDWSVEAGNAELAMRIASSVWRFWQQRGHFSEGREALERVLGLPSAQTVSPLRAKTLLALGSVAYWQQDYPTMRRYYDQGYDVYMQTDDREGQAVALQYTSFGPWMEGDIDSSIRIVGEALDQFRQLGNEQKIAELLGYQGYLYSLQGNHAKAIEPMEESIVFIRKFGVGWALADSLAGLGNVYRLAGQLDESKPHFREGLTMFRESENEAGVAMTLDMVAALASAEGKHARAVQLAGAASAIKDRLGGGAPEEMIRVGDVRETAREPLGDDAVERAWEEGRSMSIDEAVALGLED